MIEMKCGNPHGVPGCEWAEWGPEDFEEEPPCEVFE